ncbi:RloB family protein [Corynebacterium timonense]|uniref:RloB-like protein n=1 Tax=Corynebacterium timonense TaxID=441500 RepID=A0A1H1TS34_9CORY|nr:RloB family protein [Corynebacterium timonense]SDS62399.1 RloB-like protein [Corynebacterium timonense]
MRKRRRPKGSRPTQPSYLIVVQGQATELDYFKRLKSTFRIPGVNLVVEPHSPEKIVDKVRYNMANDKAAPYDRVCFVVDVDDSSPQQFQQGFNKARKSTTGGTKCLFAVSNRCFEVWLLAHFADIRGREMEVGALTAGLREHGALQAGSDKHLAADFPVKEYETASRNVSTANWNEIGPAPSTAVPKLVEELIRAAEAS